MSTEFRFIEYNPRRAMRGAEATLVAVVEDGGEQWLWMSKRDIAKNMMVFGRHPELIKAHEANEGSFTHNKEKMNVSKQSNSGGAFRQRP